MKAMRFFEHPNPDGFLCPICKTGDDKPVVLVKIAGTEKDGIIEAKQIHLDCLDLVLISKTWPTGIRLANFLFQEVPDA